MRKFDTFSNVTVIAGYNKHAVKTRLRIWSKYAVHAIISGTTNLRGDFHCMNLYVFHPLKLAYIRNNKVASTTIIHLISEELNRYFGYNNKISYEKIKIENKIDEYILEKGLILFTFVRNPYERAISSYQFRSMQYLKIYEKILYLRAKINQFLCGPEGWYSYRHKNEYATTLIPFDKLIKGIEKNGTSFDIHFEKQSRIINYDNVKFDYVGKLENFEEDMMSIMKMVGFNDRDFIAKICSIKKNSTTYRNKSSEFLTQINKDRIYDIYFDDFKNFDYKK